MDVPCSAVDARTRHVLALCRLMKLNKNVNGHKADHGAAQCVVVAVVKN